MKKVIAVFFLVFLGMVVGADDDRTQYPGVLKNSYVEAGVARMDTLLSTVPLEPGYKAASVKVPRAGAKLGIGHHFSRHLGMQISYMRPIQWAKYTDINGVPSTHTVWTNVASLTFRGTIPLGRLSFYDESGLAIVTRHGFQIDGHDVVKNATYATVLWGAGFSYRMSKNWDLQASAAYVPRNNRFHQPHILVTSLGAVLNMRPRPAESAQSTVEKSASPFPRHTILFSHSTNELGTGINSLFSSRIPIFWGGNAHVAQGLSVRYQRNIFHRRVFSLDWGASVGHWWTEGGENITTLSLFPYMRFTPIHTKPADLYAFYSLAGPTYVTKRVIDGSDTGGRFTFQDMMGVGVSACADRHLTMEVSIGHYSNGNLLPRNAGIKIPLTVTLGYAF